MLLDEPLSNLDANLREQMRRDLHELQRQLGLTTIFVTHDQEEANTISDRIAVLDQGVIQQVGAPMELYDNPVNKFVADFLGTANMLEGQLQQAASGKNFTTPSGISFPFDHPISVMFPLFSALKALKLQATRCRMTGLPCKVRQTPGVFGSFGSLQH